MFEIILYYIIFFIISLTLKDLFLALKMSFIYTTFFILPFIFWFSNKNFVEKFFLVNLIGLTYSGIYVVMDVILKISLTKITFFITTIILFIISILQKRLKNTSN
ncbi:MAG: hypothetical protein QXE31_01585 [Candidatus Woesearchaeota archaeon]